MDSERIEELRRRVEALEAEAADLRARLGTAGDAGSVPWASAGGGREMLAAINERYRLAARATNDAVWDWDLRANTVEWNEALEAA
ncbi:hypothetical protein ACFQX4_04815 [Roseomonas sp. GCM10028921]